MGIELIQVSYDADRPTVLGHDLHAMLEVETPYHKWFPRMCEYGFSDGIDYKILDGQKSPTNNPKNPWTIMTDHQLTIDMAKELCMLQRTHKGKECRQYFIELEKEWNSPEAVMARALQMADKKIKRLTEQVEEQRPSVEFMETICKSSDNILMRDMAKLLCDENINIGEKRLYNLLRDKKVLMQDKSPYQSFVDRGYFYVSESSYTTVYGTTGISSTTLVTPKGQIWLVGKVREWTKIA